MLFEDEHLLVVNKPAGWNTHAPDLYAGEGIYDWLRHREPRWANLAIIHRLDKDTSGVLLFPKSKTANRSLLEQFTARQVNKKYLLLTDRPVRRREFTAVSNIVRAGERYVSRPTGGQPAETRFRVLEKSSGRTLVLAEPITGRTHQIRVQAAENGFPVLGDVLYGGTAAPRVCLHASELRLQHPVTGAAMEFIAPADFAADASAALRAAMIDPATDAYRLIHGASDGWPDWYVDRLGEFLLSQSERPLDARQRDWLKRSLSERPTGGAQSNETPAGSVRGVYHKVLTRQIRKISPAEAAPQLVFGEPAPDSFVVRENGVRFALGFAKGYSNGLFLDQRDNRRRFLVNWVAAGFPLFQTGAARPEVLNTFAYTCAFSVCAAKAGARVTSVDLSKKYLDWGRRNFALNELDPAEHDFIFGDVFEWLRRLGKKGRQFDALVLDPPTFSQSRAHGVFRAEKDYGVLVSLALPLIAPGGVLLASTNAAQLPPEKFVQMVKQSMEAGGRKARQQHYVPQPPDFPITRAEPGYLKTLWVRMGAGHG